MNAPLFQAPREPDHVRLSGIVKQAIADAHALPATLNELMTSTLPLPESASVRDAAINEGMDDRSEGRIEELGEIVRDLLSMRYAADEIRAVVERSLVA